MNQLTKPTVLTRTAPAALRRVVASLRRSLALWAGLAGLACALYGQKLVWVDHEVILSIRWYAAGILIVLLGWLGTYKNKSMLMSPLPARRRRTTEGQKLRRGFPWGRGGEWPRYLLATAGFCVAVYCSNLIGQDYYSAAGGWGWLAGLVVMALAFVGERRKPVYELDSSAAEVEDSTDFRPSRRTEAAIFAAILLLALFLRLYRLDDWTTGVHGDEGEAGMDALNILSGNAVSPFTTGWFGQSNFYYWGIAAGMKLFGASLFGDRIFAVVMGTLMLVFFYPLVRMWFGVRTAIIATVLLSISDVTLQFTRMEASNITTPLSLVAGFYFLFLGLRTRLGWPFVLSGFSFMFGLYFYNGARLTPFQIAFVLGYLFILMPLVHLPGGYRTLAAHQPGLSRARLLLAAAGKEFGKLAHYVPQVVVFLMACIAFAAPFWVYITAHPAEQTARANEKLIFNNAAGLEAHYAQSHQVSHAPLYLGLRLPTQNDIYPVVPLFFEQTPVSVRLADDGFWPRVLWAQTTATLSILTYRFDSSSFYTFPLEPAAKPIEAVLIILGLAWALWRWRDARMAMLSLWFWPIIFVGGALTIDAPYMARLIGVVPVMAICAALPLSKLAAETISIFERLSGTLRSSRVLRAGQVLALGGTLALLCFLTQENYSDYFLRYLARDPYPPTTGQATFVRDMNRKAEAEGKLTPYYYDLGVDYIYWNHGTNRFLNHGTEGEDMANPSDQLPLLDAGDRDVYFMVWDTDKQYLDVLKAYYPEGEIAPFTYGAPGQVLFTAFHVGAKDLLAHRRAWATYAPAVGPAIERSEDRLGTGEQGTPPEGIRYPARASWESEVVAPAYSRYSFLLDTDGPGSLTIDGTHVITNTSGGHGEVDLLLARGLHTFQVAGILQNAGSRVELAWSSGASPSEAIARRFLWQGPGRNQGEGRGLVGVVRPYVPDFGALRADAATRGSGGSGITSDTGNGENGGNTEGSESGVNTADITDATSVRVDGFLGFRDTPGAAGGQPFLARWTGVLRADMPGDYAFDTYSNGTSTLLLDGTTVVDNRQQSSDGPPHASQGALHLDKGAHNLEVLYSWTAGRGYLEVFWQPPGGERRMLTSANLTAEGGIVEGQVRHEPPPAQLQSQDHAQAQDQASSGPVSSRALGGGELSGPRGVAVDAQGNIYVGDRGHHRIVVYSPDGKLLRTFGKAPAGGGARAPAYPEPGVLVDILDVAVGPDGRVYVADQANSSVSVFRPDGAFERVVPRDLLGVQQLDGIDVAPDGTLLATDPPGMQIVALSPSGGTQQGGSAQVVSANPSTDPADRLEQPVDVAAGPGGEMYAADLDKRIVRLDAGGKILARWPLPVGISEGGSRLAVSPDGTRIFMSDPDQGLVDALDVRTGRISRIGDASGPRTLVGLFQAPGGVAVGPGGLVYVVDRATGKLQVLEADSYGGAPSSPAPLAGGK